MNLFLNPRFLVIILVFLAVIHEISALVTGKASDEISSAIYFSAYCILITILILHEEK